MFLAVCEMKIALWMGFVVVGLHNLFVGVALNGCDECFLGFMCAQGSSQGFQEEERECSFGGQVWIGGGVDVRVELVWMRIRSPCLLRSPWLPLGLE